MRENTAAESAVRNYYERNTRRFLWLGGGRRALSIHRAVWGEGVRDRSEALDYTNRLVLAELLQPRDQETPPFVLDLGCGVGGSLFFLARTSPVPFQAAGITLSPLQVRLATETAGKLGLDGTCTFFEASYLDLPALPPADLAFAIESFVLGPDPSRFFASVAGALRPGGRLLVIDDFLSGRSVSRVRHPKQARWIAEFCDGWRAHSLCTIQSMEDLAAGVGLAMRKDLDLTPYLRIFRLRDRIVALAAAAGRFLPLKIWFGQDYFDSLIGGNALQQGYRHGIFEYHALTFEKIP